MQVKETIEQAIEVCEKSLYEYRYELRWFSRLLFLLYLFIGLAALVFLLSLLNIQAIGYIQVGEGLGGLAFLGLAISGGLTVAMYYYRRTPLSPFIFQEHLKNLSQEKHQRKLLLRKLADHNAHAAHYIESSEHYMRHRLPEFIIRYRKEANWHRRAFTSTQIAIILLSTTVASISGGWVDKYILIPWIIPVLSLLIAIITSLVLFFKPKDKATNLQQTADAMDLEHTACSLRIGVYIGLDDKDAHVKLAERAEILRKEQQQKQLLLEQASHVEQKST